MKEKIHIILPVHNRREITEKLLIKFEKLLLSVIFIVMEKINIAPIVLFVYNRPEHTKRTMEALKNNELANQSELFIYSDAPKNEEATPGVEQVRNYIKSISGFKKVNIIERAENFGLAKSIITGVTEIVNKYGKVIVMEDDLITAPYFLNFMNNALDYYEDEKKIWHISGWNYPINIDGLPEVFVWRLMNCWGWATWEDRWQFFEKNVDKVINEFTDKDIYQFNLEGTEDFWKQVTDNQAGIINTWAIFWYATIFKKQGFCINPAQTYVQNIGFDGTGEHCSKKDIFVRKLNKEKKINLKINLKEDIIVVERIKQFYKSQRSVSKGFVKKVLRKLGLFNLVKKIVRI